MANTPPISTGTGLFVPLERGMVELSVAHIVKGMLS